MRDDASTLELRPTLIGSISVGLTACGAPVDTLGFANVLAVLVAGASFGTAANVGTLTVKIQESATATGTGALWTDITDDPVCAGSFKFSDISLASATNPIMYMGKKAGKLGVGRQRYIRAHATMAGTDACNPKFSVAFLLGRPIDTLYINNAATMATGNTQYFLGR